MSRALLVAAAVIMAAVATAPPVGAQIPNAWPQPVATPVPTATPEPEPAREDPPVEPAAEPVGAAIDPTPTPVAESEQSAEDSGEGADGDKTGATDRSKEEINPGDVAFTDFQPFDIDDIAQEPIKTKWGNFVAGLKGITRYRLFDGKVLFRLGARFQLDATGGFESDEYLKYYSPIEVRGDVRRALIFAAGRIADFNFNVGFNVGADTGIDSAWIEGAKGGLEVWGFFLGKLRLGFFNEPFSLERQTSSYYIGLMERSLPVQTFAPGSNLGAMIHDSRMNGRLAWQAGLFSVGQDNEANASGSLLSLTGRISYLPVYEDEGRKLVHIGVSASTRSPNGGDVQYASRPEARYVDQLVDTGRFSASRVNLIGAEVAAVRGPVWAAAEFIGADTTSAEGGDPFFWGLYGQVGWFITGESRNYRNNSGTFDRVLPKARYRGGNPFSMKSGGALEVVGRISTIDLTSGLIEGGEMTNLSGALSWYVNPQTRLEFNYIHSMPKDRGSANIFLLRLQYKPW